MIRRKCLDASDLWLGSEMLENGFYKLPISLLRIVLVLDILL